MTGNGSDGSLGQGTAAKLQCRPAGRQWNPFNIDTRSFYHLTCRTGHLRTYPVTGYQANKIGHSTKPFINIRPQTEHTTPAAGLVIALAITICDYNHPVLIGNARPI